MLNKNGNMKIIELHAHASPHKHGIDKAVNIVKKCVQKKIDGIVFTEHTHFKNFDIWNQENINKVKEFADAKHFIIYAGQEVTTNKGDFLIYGSEKFYSKGIKIENIIAEKTDSMFITWAHPLKNYSLYNIPFIEGIDAFEIYNKSYSSRKCFEALQILLTIPGVKIAGGSDIHLLRHVSICPSKIDLSNGLVKGLKLGTIPLPSINYFCNKRL